MRASLEFTSYQDREIKLLILGINESFYWIISEAPGTSAIHEEGNLTRKHEWEAQMKKAKDRYDLKVKK